MPSEEYTYHVEYGDETVEEYPAYKALRDAQGWVASRLSEGTAYRIIETRVRVVEKGVKQ